MRATTAKAFVLVGLCALSTATVIGPESSRAGPTRAATAEAERQGQQVPVAGSITIRVALDAAGRGSFLARGAVSAAGKASASRSVARRRIRLTETLEGSSGSFVIRIDQACGKKQSTWRVVRGSGAYSGVTGGGRGTGGIPCKGPRKPLRAVYRGTVQIRAPQALATPGTYGGWTAQNERVTFEVLAGGRQVTSFRIERLHATCTPPLDLVVQPAFLSTYPIGADGTFSIAFGSSTLTGRISGGEATGIVTYASSATTPYVCTSGAVTWSASTPAPPLSGTVPGNYCGSTAQSLGVCLTLAPGGKVTYLRVEARLDCVLWLVDGAPAPIPPEQARFQAVMGFGRGGSAPLRSNLSFEVLGSLQGDAGGDYILRGTFDSAGRVSGTLSLYRPSFDDQEGRLYTCKDATLDWRATRVT